MSEEFKKVEAGEEIEDISKREDYLSEKVNPILEKLCMILLEK